VRLEEISSDDTDERTGSDRLERDSTESLIGPYRCLTDAEHASIERAWTKQNGGWYGNDTVWRMVLDLNKILRYGRRDGTLARASQRRIVTFVDGLWAGELEGPLKPSPKVAGVLLAGADSLAIDVVAATLMGFDYRKIKLLRRGLAVTDLPVSSVTPDAIEVVSNEPAWSDLRGIGEHHLGFAPPRGWKGHIELEELEPVPAGAA